MATTIEKTAAFLRQLMVKQAALLTLDSFLTKVADALPVTKRAAFRVMQADLSSGNTLNHAIKVAFPRLSGEQRGVLAVNLCKCAADAEKNTRTFESYAVPVKEGNRMLREKCSMFENIKPDGPSLAPRPPMGGAPSPFGNEISDLLKERLTERRMAEATASPNTDPGYIAPPSRYVNDARADNHDIPSINGNTAPLKLGPSGAAPAKSESIAKSAPTAKDESAAAPPISGPTEGGKFDLSSLLGQIGGYAQDPRVLGGLAAGGLGAYGLSRLLRRKKRRPELE